MRPESRGEFTDYCDCCCEVKKLVAFVRSVPEEDVWLDIVCGACLRCLLGAEPWVSGDERRQP